MGTGLLSAGATVGILFFLTSAPMAVPRACPLPIYLKEQGMQKITGNFEVTLTPQPIAAGMEAAKLGRFTLDKHFSGDLNAHSLGEMLSAGTEVKGSAGYVAIERVTGKLCGKNGSFVLMHSGTMARGQPQLNVQVVPDSGTDQLKGLVGNMGIQITNGRHDYTFEFTLPE